MERKFHDKQRGRERRKRRPLVLLLAEGKNQTESLYFQNFNSRNSKYTIKVFSRGYTDPDGMLNSLKKECRDADFSAEENGDVAGVVLDLDCSERKAGDIRRLSSVKGNDKYRFFVSNPCFEVWFVAHIHDLRGAYNSSSDVIADLKRHIPNYSKSVDIFQKIKGSTYDAIERERRKERQYEGEVWPSTSCNPRTDVAQLVEILLQNNKS